MEFSQRLNLELLIFSPASVVCILSGGNISSSRIARVIDRGMAAEGRLCKFSATLPDAPGAMARLLARVHECGADVKSFVPERAWMRRDIFTMSVSEGEWLFEFGSIICARSTSSAR